MKCNKYPHVKNDLLGYIKVLEEDPSAGDPIPAWNKEIWKVRVASSDVKKGKRGGYRLIYFWKAGDMRIYLLVAYFRGEKAKITKKETLKPYLRSSIRNWDSQHLMGDRKIGKPRA